MIGELRQVAETVMVAGVPIWILYLMGAIACYAWMIKYGELEGSDWFFAAGFSLYFWHIFLFLMLPADRLIKWRKKRKADKDFRTLTGFNPPQSWDL